MSPLKALLALALLCSTASIAAMPAQAHFPWLAVDQEGRAILFFGENPADRQYSMPKTIASATIQHRIDGPAGAEKPDAGKPDADLHFIAVESDSFVGRRTEQKIPKKGQLQSTVVYGNYHGMKLTYSTQLILEMGPADSVQKPSGNLALEAALTEKDGGVTAHIYWQGKPLPASKVQLFCEEGHEEATATTDELGTVHFSADEVEEGLNGLLVGRVDKDSPGELNGASYTGEAHYLTVTFLRP